MSAGAVDSLRELEVTLRAHARRLRAMPDDTGETRGIALGLDALATSAGHAIARAAEHAEPEPAGVTGDQLRGAHTLMGRFLIGAADGQPDQTGAAMVDFHAMAGLRDGYRDAAREIGQGIAWALIDNAAGGPGSRDRLADVALLVPAAAIANMIASGTVTGITLGAAAGQGITDPDGGGEAGGGR